MSINATVQKVTPTMAAEWLGDRAPNRALSTSRVKKYARQMKAGTWQENGQPIILNGGNPPALIDGQHRCKAVIESGKTVPMLVVRGVSSDAFLTMDTGGTRSATDLLSIAGATHCAVLAAALGWLWRWEGGHFNDDVSIPLGATRPVPQEILAMHRERPKMQEIAAYAVNRRRGFNYIYPGPFAFCVYLFDQIDSADMRTFFGKLIVGADLKEHSPILRLRKRLIQNKERPHERLPAQHMIALTIKAWNHYRDGRPTRALIFRPTTEPFPVPK